MIIAKVIGTVVSTRKNNKLRGFKFSIVKPIELHGGQQTIVAIDTMVIDIGEIVHAVIGSAPKITINNPDEPVDAAVIGIVDSADYMDILEA